MQGGKNWILPKEMNANRFFWDSRWLEIWSIYFCASMGPNGGSVTMDSVQLLYTVEQKGGKSDRKQHPLPYGLRIPYGNPQA
jgi:hypothetical protein